MALSVKDYNKLLDLIETTHLHMDRRGLFEEVCSKMRDLAGIEEAFFIPVDAGTGKFSFPGNLAFNACDRSLLIYCIYFAPHLPILLKEMQMNEPVRTMEVIPETSIADMAYGDGRETMRAPFYEYSCALTSRGEALGVICFNRKDAGTAFSDREKEIIQLFLPHLAGALHMLDLQEVICSSLDAGIIVAGEGGHPYFINDKAEYALDGKRAEDLFNEGTGLCPAILSSKNGDYSVRVVKVRPSGKERIVVLERLSAGHDFRERVKGLGLSPRQEEIACLAVCGYSNAEIAEKLFITEQTVKDHLRTIFKELHVHRRGEMTAKILGITD